MEKVWCCLYLLWFAALVVYRALNMPAVIH